MPWADGDDLTPTNLNTKSSHNEFDVLDPTYGGVGGGTSTTGADDAAAVRAALSAAAAAGGGDVLLPPVLAVGSKLTVAGNVRLRGSGIWGGTTLHVKSTFSDTAVIESANTGGQAAVGLEDLTIQGHASNTISVAGINLQGQFIGTVLRNVQVYNTPSVGIRYAGSSGALTGGGPLLFDTVGTNETSGDGILIECSTGAGQLDGTMLINCLTERFGAGNAGVRIRTNAAGSTLIFNTKILQHRVELGSNNQTGIVVDGASDTEINGLAIAKPGGLTGDKGIVLTSHIGNLRCEVRHVTNGNLITPIVDDSKNSIQIAAPTYHVAEYITPDYQRFATKATPSSGTASGVTGMTSWDANYVYVCTSANSWSRATLNTF